LSSFGSGAVQIHIVIVIDCAVIAIAILSVCYACWLCQNGWTYL